MSLDKAIKYGKEHRKEYRGGKVFDRNCRNHGTCSWCRENRLFKSFKRAFSSLMQLREHLGLHTYGKKIKGVFK
jgi:hypothetical protein